MNGHVVIIIAGKNRTLMTIENIRCVMKHLKYDDYEFIIGSDISEPGHIEALSYFLLTTGKKFQFVETLSENNGLGALINLCNEKAFSLSDNVMFIENDLILHKDISIHEYIMGFNSNAFGCVNFRYMLPIGKCLYKTISFNGHEYVYHVPVSHNSTFTVFGSLMYNRRYYETLGPVMEIPFGSELGGPEHMMDRRYMDLYENGTLFKNGSLMVIDKDHLTETYNGDAAPFYHIGLKCQHTPGANWNSRMTRSEYHFLSDDDLDRKFRKLFEPDTNGDATCS